MSPRESLCECGHTRMTHYHENTMQAAEAANAGRSGPCKATIYTHVYQGVTAAPCKCSEFKEARAE